ncbi:hypothetical protein BaRGS_00015155 [Batillaria attramentaria]|uniref:Uncharacterized protein n=1 Tax=Batillaria attramentaria TaxID=370345 RepID=A0ABD0L292_9CAEN
MGLHGNLCDKNCSDKCAPSNNGIITCRQDDGRCTTECQVGYYYGVGSCEECGHCLPGDVCDKHNGHCLHGCRDGFDGELCDLTASESSGTQDGGDIVGPVVGGLLGAGALIGLSILLAAIIRRQRSRDGPTSRDCDERREAQFSPEDAQARVDTEGLKTDTSDADTHYESLEKYENPDDIKPYSTLEASHGRRTNVNIQGDKEAVLYHNITSYKTQ